MFFSVLPSGGQTSVFEPISPILIFFYKLIINQGVIIKYFWQEGVNWLRFIHFSYRTLYFASG
jgi:hypothetical protein